MSTRHTAPIVTAPAPNAALLRQTLAYIEEHPDDWDQGSWRYCFAAWAAVLEGGEWLSDESVCMVVRDDDPDSDILIVDGKRLVLGEDRARRVLRLTWPQTFDLFAGDSDLDDLRALVAEMTSGAS